MLEKKFIINIFRQIPSDLCSYFQNEIKLIVINSNKNIDIRFLSIIYYSKLSNFYT